MTTTRHGSASRKGRRAIAESVMLMSEWCAGSRGGRSICIMRLAETDGKALLRRHGVAVPRGVLLRGGDAPPAEAAQWPGHILKAQILEGGRGKRGLVRRLADLGALADTRRLIHAAVDDPDIPLLLEETVPIAREIYLAIRIDGTRQALELLVAPQGGEEVEKTDAVTRIAVDP